MSAPVCVRLRLIKEHHTLIQMAMNASNGLMKAEGQIRMP
jgi:hypothetical protein